MLLEAMVAVLALATVMALAPGSPALKEDPNLIYAAASPVPGAGRDQPLARPLLRPARFSTFVYDTLDVCTRLARYILQEFTGLKGRAGIWLATAATLVLPCCSCCRQRKGLPGRLADLRLQQPAAGGPDPAALRCG